MFMQLEITSVKVENIVQLICKFLSVILYNFTLKKMRKGTNPVKCIIFAL